MVDLRCATYLGRVIPRTGEQGVVFGQEQADDVGRVANEALDRIWLLRIKGPDDAILAARVDQALEMKVPLAIGKPKHWGTLWQLACLWNQFLCVLIRVRIRTAPATFKHETMQLVIVICTDYTLSYKNTWPDVSRAKKCFARTGIETHDLPTRVILLEHTFLTRMGLCPPSKAGTLETLKMLPKNSYGRWQLQPGLANRKEMVPP